MASRSGMHAACGGILRRQRLRQRRADGTHGEQSWLYALTGRDSLSAESLEQWNVLQGRPLFPPGDVRSAFRTGGAGAMYGPLVDAGSGGRALTVDLAFWYHRSGDNVRALDLLEEAAERHEIWLIVHLDLGLFGGLEQEPRYQAVVERVYGR